MLYILNQRERELVFKLDQDFRRIYKMNPVVDRNLFYFLGDRYEFSRTWSAKSGKIPTYRLNQAKYLQRSSMQVMTGQDKLASLGWPVEECAAAELGTSVLPAMDSQRAHLLAGNSMHLTVSAIVLLVGTVCFGKA